MAEDLMNRIMKRMTDDRGLFQGGEQGRLFGRVRDALEGNRGRDTKRTPETATHIGIIGGGSGEYIPDVSPEYTAFMEDKTPENLKAWQITTQPGGTEGYNKRVQDLIAEGKSLSEAERGAWTWWGSDESQQYEDLDYEIAEIDKVFTVDNRKNRWAWTGGEEPEGGKSVLKDYVELWGWGVNDPVRTSQRYTPMHEWQDAPKTSTRVANIVSDILEGRTSWKPYEQQEIPDFFDGKNVTTPLGSIVQQVSSVAPEDRDKFIKRTKASLEGAGYGTGDPRIEDPGY